MTYPVLEFCSNHPFAAFFLAWPVSLVLMSIAWAASNIITHSITAVNNIIVQIGVLLVTLVRGHAPAAPVVQEWMKGDESDGGSNGGDNPTS